MPFRRSPYNTLTPSRSQLLASRAKLAQQERAAVERVNDLRWIMDSMSDELRQKALNPGRVAALVIAAGDAARSGCPPPLPPKGSVARFVVLAGMKARGEKDIPDE
jgi:hypothetical protein